MTKYCTAPSCQGEAAGFSDLCHQHKQVQRRHGAPDQEGTTVHDLKPYVARVVARQVKNSDNDAWTILRARWGAAVADAGRAIEEAQAGAVHVRHEVQAAVQIQHLGQSVPPDDVVRTALAMYVYREDQPRRFRSDRGFDFQLVRRVRGLSPLNAGSYWDAKEKRSRKVYRDLPPRTVEALAGIISEAFGVAGIMLARKEQAEAAKVQEESTRLAKAMEALT